MKAFHGDPAIKEKYLSRVRAHHMADEIIKGKYWEYVKGCLLRNTKKNRVIRKELIGETLLKVRKGLKKETRQDGRIYISEKV